MATTILVKPTNGATFGASSALPATYDSGGYAAVTFTTVGEILDIGEIAKAYSMLSHQSVARGYPLKIKDVYDIGDVSITMARVAGDTGQDILQTAISSAASYSFKVTLPSAATANFTAKVTKIGLGSISPSGFETLVLSLSVDPESLFESGI